MIDVGMSEPAVVTDLHQATTGQRWKLWWWSRDLIRGNCETWEARGGDVYIAIPRPPGAWLFRARRWRGRHRA